MSTPPTSRTYIPDYEIDMVGYKNHLTSNIKRSTPSRREQRAIWIIGSFAALVALSATLPTLPLHAQLSGITSSSTVTQWLGLAFCLTFLGTAISGPTWTPFARRCGRSAALARAVIGTAIVMSLMGIAHEVAAPVALRLVAVVVGGYGAASMVVIGTKAPLERAGWAIGLLSSGALTGNLVGPMVGILLSISMGVQHTFFVGSLIVVVAVMAAIILSRGNFSRQTDAKIRAVTEVVSPARSNKSLIAALVLATVMVLLANEPIIAMYIEQFAGWCRRRL